MQESPEDRVDLVLASSALPLALDEIVDVLSGIEGTPEFMKDPEWIRALLERHAEARGWVHKRRKWHHRRGA